MERFISGEKRKIFRIHSHNLFIACLAGGGGAKKIFQYCNDDSGIIIYLRALQGHSGRHLIDPSLQDNVVIPSGFFQYIYHIGCAFNLRSVIDNGLIPGGQNSSKRQTVFFLPIDPRDCRHISAQFVVFSALSQCSLCLCLCTLSSSICSYQCDIDDWTCVCFGSRRI